MKLWVVVVHGSFKGGKALNLLATSSQAEIKSVTSRESTSSMPSYSPRLRASWHLEGTWGINFPLIINDLRPQKTTSSKEVAQCQVQDLAKSLVWSSTPGWQRIPVPEKTRHCRIRAWSGSVV